MKHNTIKLSFEAREFSAHNFGPIAHGTVTLICPELNELSIQLGDYLILELSRLRAISALQQLTIPILEITKIQHTNKDTIVSVHACMYDDHLDQEEKFLLNNLYRNPDLELSAEINYSLLKTTAEDVLVSIEKIRVEKMPQTNDVLVYQSINYQIDAICWDLRNSNKIHAYLIAEQELATTSNKPSAYYSVATIFDHHLRLRKRYKQFRTGVMHSYQGSLNLAKKARDVVLRQFKIKTFLGNSKKRALRNGLEDLPANLLKTAAQFVPVPYANTIWAFGVDIASNYIIKFFTFKNPVAMASQPLEKMIQDSEFKYTEFSERLHLSYWEVMELYQKIIAHSGAMHTLTEEQFMGKHGYAHAIATWDGLREETLEYAQFLKNIVATMEHDIYCMDTQMQSVLLRFEACAMAHQAKKAHLRTPETVAAAPETFL